MQLVTKSELRGSLMQKKKKKRQRRTLYNDESINQENIKLKKRKYKI